MDTQDNDMSEQRSEETKHVELPAEQMDIIHELVLRGLRDTDPTDREYGEAYDAFVEDAGYPLRIGDQPTNVRETWYELVQEGADGRR